MPERAAIRWAEQGHDPDLVVHWYPAPPAGGVSQLQSGIPEACATLTDTFARSSATAPLPGDSTV